MVNKSAYRLLIAMMVLSGFQNAWYFGQLPDRVAIHFNAAGQPDDWASRGQATALMLGIQVGLPLLIVGISWGISYLPNALINIPNRDYWLSPERRAESLSFVRRFLSWIALLMSLFVMAINHLTFVANRTGEGLPREAFLGLLVGYLVVTALLVVKLYRHFRLPAGRN